MNSESKRTVFRTCSLCEATCGLELEVVGDRVVRARGDSEDVFSHGYICPKGTAIAAIHEDPDRLKRPLIRRNGQPGEVDWDEAFAELEQRMLPLLEDPGRTASG